jgi:hypothetical protein
MWGRGVDFVARRFLEFIKILWLKIIQIFEVLFATKSFILFSNLKNYLQLFTPIFFLPSESIRFKPDITQQIVPKNSNIHLRNSSSPDKWENVGGKNLIATVREFPIFSLSIIASVLLMCSLLSPKKSEVKQKIIS